MKADEYQYQGPQKLMERLCDRMWLLPHQTNMRSGYKTASSVAS